MFGPLWGHLLSSYCRRPFPCYIDSRNRKRWIIIIHPTAPGVHPNFIKEVSLLSTVTVHPSIRYRSNNTNGLFRLFQSGQNVVEPSVREGWAKNPAKHIIIIITLKFFSIELFFSISSISFTAFPRDILEHLVRGCWLVEQDDKKKGVFSSSRSFGCCRNSSQHKTAQEITHYLALPAQQMNRFLKECQCRLSVLHHLTTVNDGRGEKNWNYSTIVVEIASFISWNTIPE